MNVTLFCHFIQVTYSSGRLILMDSDSRSHFLVSTVCFITLLQFLLTTSVLVTFFSEEVIGEEIFLEAYLLTTKFTDFHFQVLRSEETELVVWMLSSFLILAT